MGNLCIIPARGGSKRVPRKNIKSFLGQPIIAYSIKAAIKSNLFSEVMVSTDDKEIAEIAKKNGAKVPFLRSEKTSNDHATTFQVLEEVISNYKTRGVEFEHVCCLYATAPFVTAEKLAAAFGKMKTENKSSIFPVVEFSFPIQRALILNNGQVEFREPENRDKRSQDLSKSYHDAGQFYFMTTQVIEDKQELVGKKSSVLIISELEAQDIDNETDWKLAELKFKLLK